MLSLFEIMFANVMILKIFLCHYNSQKHQELIPGLTTHCMNKCQVVEALFHRYPNKWTLDIKYFCQQTTLFMGFAQVFSPYLSNRVQQEHASFRTKPFGELQYENFVLCNQLVKYNNPKDEHEVPFFIRLVRDKHFHQVFKDLQTYKTNENQIPRKYKTANLRQLVPQNDYSIADQVRLKIWNVANLPQ